MNGAILFLKQSVECWDAAAQHFLDYEPVSTLVDLPIWDEDADTTLLLTLNSVLSALWKTRVIWNALVQNGPNSPQITFIQNSDVMSQKYGSSKWNYATSTTWLMDV